jgi:protease YdgD
MLLATGAAGLPGLGPREARVAVDGNAVPWAAVVRVQVPGISRCTGFLVGPRTAVTAAHCLYGRRLGHFVPPSAVHVLLGYASGDYAQHVLASSFQVGDGYAPSLPAGQGTDVAVLTLAAAIGSPGEVLALADGPVPRGARLMAGGFSQDRAERLQADVSCTALGYRPGPAGPVLVHDCAGTRGTSGGPVLMQGAGEAWRVAGVQVAGNVDDAGGVAVPAASIRLLLHP